MVTSKSGISSGLSKTLTNTNSPTKTSITPVTQPVTISPVTTANNNGSSSNGGGSSLTVTATGGANLSQESPNQNKSAGGLSPRSMAGSNGAAKRLGRPPKKGTHIATNSLGSSFSVGGATSSIKAPGTIDESGVSDAKRLKTEETVTKPPEAEASSSGAGGEKKEGQDLHRLMMFGATLNPSSGMAKEMTSVLQVDIYF